MVFRGAHASKRAGERVLAVANFSLYLLILPLGEKGKFVSARRRNQHAWRRALPISRIANLLKFCTHSF